MKINIVSGLIIVLAALIAAPLGSAAAPADSVLRVADDDEEQMWIVVVNHEGRYSIWPEGRDLALGWTAEGFRGTRAQCLAYARAHS